MPKASKRTSANKKLEALRRSQQMSALLKAGGIQSQALLDSAGETRPSDESHVVELLEQERYARPEAGRARSGGRASRPRSQKMHMKSRHGSRAKTKRR